MTEYLNRPALIKVSEKQALIFNEHSRDLLIHPIQPTKLTMRSLKIKLISGLLVTAAAMLEVTYAYTIDRRSLIQEAMARTTGLIAGFPLVVVTAPEVAQGGDSGNDDDVNHDESVYIGCGCFWHLQHSIAVFERDQLGRNGGQLTCKTGYAGGGQQQRAQQVVCYHNSDNIANYGSLGYGEVVKVELPCNRIVDLMRLYFENFDSKSKGEFFSAMVSDKQTH